MISLFFFLAAATMWSQTLTGLKSGYVRSKYGFGSEQDDTGLTKVLLGKKLRKEQSPVAFWAMFARPCTRLTLCGSWREYVDWRLEVVGQKGEEVVLSDG